MRNADLISSVINDWWYYSVELSPGIMTKGMDAPEAPMLPRMTLRNCNLQGMKCLDIGSMEGLIPAMMVRKGAKEVLATDALPHCEKKMNILKQIYDVGFDYRSVGLLYDLSSKLQDCGGFDLINLSGVLYHVFSPMHVLAGIRPLLKKNGLIIISTNIVNRGDYTLQFNKAGGMQQEANTFWYHSVPMLEEIIRFFKLVPIDFLYCPHTPINPYTYVPGLDSGYMSVVCRAVDGNDVEQRDVWAARARMGSWEYLSLCDGDMMTAQTTSSIKYEGDEKLTADNREGLNLLAHMNEQRRIFPTVQDSKNSQFLYLGDMS